MAVFLTLSIVAVVFLGMYGRFFGLTYDDAEAREFDRFLNMLRPSPIPSDTVEAVPRPRVWPVRGSKFPLRLPTVTKPLQLGPARPTCRPENFIECNRGSFDGYSLQEHQNRLDLTLGKAMVSGRLNVSHFQKILWIRCLVDINIP